MLSEFQEVGFVVVPNLITQDTCEMLRDYFFSRMPEDIKFGDVGSDTRHPAVGGSQRLGERCQKRTLAHAP